MYKTLGKGTFKYIVYYIIYKLSKSYIKAAGFNINNKIPNPRVP